MTDTLDTINNDQNQSFDDICREMRQEMLGDNELNPIYVDQDTPTDQAVTDNIPFDYNLIDHPGNNPEVEMFLVKDANKWLEDSKSRPIPQMLFDKLWFEHELCILFADTNLGKSILAVQIADGISRGVSILSLPMEATAQKVLYFDFELSDKQFEARYSNNYTDHYTFSNNLIRIEINPDAKMEEGDTFEDWLTRSIIAVIERENAKIVIIDNLTYLRQGTENAKDALPLMKDLKELKNKYDLSILVLAHTPKRNLSNPITRNDLQGSKMLINFCDSCFAVGESTQGKNTRYIKQIKQRNCEPVYDAKNVIVCEICKPDNFLQFRFLSYGYESEHLRQLTDSDRQSIIDRAKELGGRGIPQRQIANELGISLGCVNKYLNQ